MDVPSVSVVTGVEPSGAAVVVHKEYAGGFMAEFEVTLPAVLGIQAARQSPRYAPVSKVRQVQQSATIDTLAAQAGDAPPGGTVERLEPPAKGEGATMLESAEALLEILKDKGVV